MEVEINRHGVGDNFHSIIQGTIMLDINQLIHCVSNLLNPGRLGVVFTCIVDLQLHTKIAAALAIENGLRFIVVVMNHTMICISAVATAIIFPPSIIL